MEIGPIFIFASGQRCGSTLLQRFLCTHPDVLIWGEHDGVLNKMFDQFDRLLEWQRLFGHHYEKYQQNGVDNFIANMNPPVQMVYESQELLVRNYWQRPAERMGKRVWGFKEVLYDADMALKLRTLFPEMKVIFITRSVFDCFTSLLHEERLKPGETYVPLKEIWTRNRTIEALGHWVRINRSFLDTTEVDANWVFSLTYEMLTQDVVGVTRQLVDWLGLNLDDFDLSVFDRKIYTDRHNGPDNRVKITWADLSAEEYALITTPEILNISRQLNFTMPQPKHKVVRT